MNPQPFKNKPVAILIDKDDKSILADAIRHVDESKLTLQKACEAIAYIRGLGTYGKTLKMLNEDEIKLLAKNANKDVTAATRYAIYLFMFRDGGNRSKDIQYEQSLTFISKYSEDYIDRQYAQFLLADLNINSSLKNQRAEGNRVMNQLSCDESFKKLVSEYQSHQLDIGESADVAAPVHAAVSIQRPIEKHTPVTVDTSVSPSEMNKSAKTAAQRTSGVSMSNNEKNEYYRNFIFKVQKIMLATRADCANKGEKVPALFEKIDEIFKNERALEKGKYELIMSNLGSLEKISLEETSNLGKKLLSLGGSRMTNIIHKPASVALLSAFQKIMNANPNNENENGIAILNNYLKKIRPLESPEASPASSPRRE